MAQPPKEIVLVHSQSISANGNTGTVVVPPDYLGLIIRLSTGTPTGTSPTLDVYVQQGFRAPAAGDITDGVLVSSLTPTIWDDYIHFTQVTGTASTQVQTARIIAEIGTSASNSPTASILAASDAALSGATVLAGPLGMWWRVKWVVGGTTPVFPTTILTAQFMMNQS